MDVPIDTDLEEQRELNPGTIIDMTTSLKRRIRISWHKSANLKLYTTYVVIRRLGKGRLYVYTGRAVHRKSKLDRLAAVRRRLAARGLDIVDGKVVQVAAGVEDEGERMDVDVDLDRLMDEIIEQALEDGLEGEQIEERALEGDVWVIDESQPEVALKMQLVKVS